MVKFLLISGGIMKSRSLLFMMGALLLIPSTAIPNPSFRCAILFIGKNLSERVDYELKSATSVFSGKVIAKEYRPIKNSAEHPPGSEELVMKIAVEQWWKGDGREEMEMYTGEIKEPNGFVWSYAE